MKKEKFCIFCKTFWKSEAVALLADFLALAAICALAYFGLMAGWVFK